MINCIKSKLLISTLLLSPLASVAQANEQLDEDNCNATFMNVAQNLHFDLILEVDPITPGFAILEGPIWLDGSLVMSHIGYKVDGVNPSDRIAYRDGEIKVIQSGYLSNGLTFNHLGHVVSARHFDGTITGVENGRVFADEYHGTRFNSPNDLVFASDGNLYFTDPDWQAPDEGVLQSSERSYHVSPWGQVSEFGDGVIEKPNGVMLSKDEQTVYVGGTNGRDSCGNLFIAANNKINIVSDDEVYLGSEEIPGITNVAFGGESGRDIYVTTLGEKPAVYRAQNQWPVSGLPY